MQHTPADKAFHGKPWTDSLGLSAPRVNWQWWDYLSDKQDLGKCQE